MFIKILNHLVVFCLDAQKYTLYIKYAIINKVKFWRLIGKAVKPETGETIQELSNTAVTDINCFCIEFNASVAKNTAIFVAFCTTKSVKSI